MKDCDLLSAAAEAGFYTAALVDTEDIPFDFAFRKYCEDNLCGQYGANYSCPPACGSCEEMRRQIVSRKKALVLQTLWEIPDFRDISAILHAKNTHYHRSAALAEVLRHNGIPGFIVGAGGCSLCTPCALKEGLPCRFPEVRYSCMSAYCIYVKGLCDLCGMNYDFGPGRVAFFGMYVFGGCGAGE